MFHTIAAIAHSAAHFVTWDIRQDHGFIVSAGIMVFMGVCWIIGSD